MFTQIFPSGIDESDGRRPPVRMMQDKLLRVRERLQGELLLPFLEAVAEYQGLKAVTPFLEGVMQIQPPIWWDIIMNCTVDEYVQLLATITSCAQLDPDSIYVGVFASTEAASVCIRCFSYIIDAKYPKLWQGKSASQLAQVCRRTLTKLEPGLWPVFLWLCVSSHDLEHLDDWLEPARELVGTKEVSRLILRCLYSQWKEYPHRGGSFTYLCPYVGPLYLVLKNEHGNGTRRWVIRNAGKALNAWCEAQASMMGTWGPREEALVELQRREVEAREVGIPSTETARERRLREATEEKAGNRRYLFKREKKAEEVPTRHRRR
jgi:hypothetical protein